MDSQKGSVKDRLRARKLFIKYKISKRKKERELLKKKKQEEQARIKAEQIRLYGKSYSKPKVFILTIVGLLLGLITPKSSKRKIEEKLNIIEKEQKQIFLRLEQDKDVKEIYRSIDNTYQKLEDLKKVYKRKIIINNFNPLEKDKILNKIDSTQKELIVINEICHNKAKQENKMVNDFTNKEPKKEAPSISLDKNKTISSNKVGISNTNANADINSNNIKNVAVNKKDNTLLSTIKTMNNDIKEYSKEFDYWKNKVTNEELYNTLFEYEFKLKQLLKEYKKMLEDYNLLKEQYNIESLEDILDIDIVDKFELRKNEKTILNKIDACEKLLVTIENKKQFLSSKIGVDKNKKEKPKTTIDNILKKEEKKNKPKIEEDKKELKEQFDDVYLANKMIINNIIEERRIIQKISRKIGSQTPVVRKRTVFTYAKRFTGSILNFGFSLLPFRYFRNRRLGTLVSSIMLNNSLRTTRKILTINTYQENYLLYNSIINEIKTNEDYISKTYDVCLNSLSQIQNIKEYLNVNYSMSMEYDAELLEFNRQLDSLSNTLLGQINSLQNISNNYKDLHQKVKVLDGYNGRY